VLLVRLDFLQGEVQKRADVQNETQLIPLADITEYINRAIARVHGLLAKSGEPYYRTVFQWTTTSGQQTYYTTAATGVPAGTAVLPTDMFLIIGLDAQIQNAFWANCDRMNFEQRNDLQQSNAFTPIRTVLYDYNGSGPNAAIYLQPPPNGVMPLRVWYFPVAPQLAAPSDTWDSANRWDSYVIAFAARYCAEKDENYELCARLDKEVAEMEATIKAEGESRISGAAPKIRRRRYRKGGWPWGIPGGIP